MGQLGVYTVQDIYIIAVMSGVLCSYFAEEIEATIESVLSYAYSANGVSKKTSKLVARRLPAGDMVDAMHFTENLLGLAETKFVVIAKPIDEKIIWQDQILLRKWIDAVNRENAAKLEDEHNNWDD